MSPKQTAQALKLYRAYKCDSREYRELAESIGIQTTELNRLCWQIIRDRKQQKVN